MGSGEGQQWRDVPSGQQSNQKLGSKNRALTPLPTTATVAYASKDSIGWMQKVGDARLRLAAGEQKQEATGEEPPH